MGIYFCRPRVPLPIRPHSHIFEFLVEMSFFHVLLDFSAVQSRADGDGKVGEGKAEVSGFGNMLLELSEIDFVESIGTGVVGSEVVGFFLIGDKSGTPSSMKSK